MNERTITEQQMTHLHTELLGAEITKHSDRFTKAIPDISIAWGYTYWVEMKFLRKGESLKDVIDQDQVIKCHSLWQATGGRCWIVIFGEFPRNTSIWNPRHLGGKIWPKVYAPDHWLPAVLDVRYEEPSGFGQRGPFGYRIKDAMKHHSVRVPEWNYLALPRLIHAHGRF